MEEELRVKTNPVVRTLWLITGVVAFVLGTIGIFLPVLPTFPFYLLTAVAFANSSERLHNRFVNSKFYKNNIEEFLETKSLPIRSKLSVLLSLTIFMGIGFYFMHLIWARLILAVVWLVHVVYIGFIVKTRK